MIQFTPASAVDSPFTITGSYSGDSNNLMSSNTFSLTIDFPASVVTSVTGLDAGPGYLAYDAENGDLYVTISQAYADGSFQNYGLVDVISSSTNTVVDSVTVPLGPIGIAYDPSTQDVYVVISSTNTVDVISSSTNTVIDSVPVCLDPYEIAYDPANSDLYTDCNGSYESSPGVYTNEDTVDVISDSTNTVVTSVTVGVYPFGIAFDPTNDDVYVTCIGSDLDLNIVDVISSSTNLVIDTVDVGTEPEGVAFDPVNNDMYVTGISNITVISGTNNFVANVTAPIGGVGTSVDLAFDAANNDMYADVESYPYTFVYIISSSDNTLLDTVSLGAYEGVVNGMAYAPTNGDVYVAAYESNEVYVVGPNPTSTSLTCLPATIDTDSPSICTATVSDFIDLITGETVSFYQSAGLGSVTFPSPATCELSLEGTCSITVTGGVAGDVSVEAYYPGDAENGPSSSNPAPITVLPESVKITFAQSGLDSSASGTVLTVDTGGSGASCTGGVPTAITQSQFPYTTASLTVGTDVCYSYSSPVPSSNSGEQFAWSSTSGLGQTTQSGSFTASSAGTITGEYITQYQVALVVNPPGGGTTLPSATAYYNSGTLPISASPASGYSFSGWSSSTGSITFASTGTTSSSTNPDTATIKGPGTITADFSAITTTSTVTATATVTSTITSTSTGTSTSTVTVSACGTYTTATETNTVTSTATTTIAGLVRPAQATVTTTQTETTTSTVTDSTVTTTTSTSTELTPTCTAYATTTTTTVTTLTYTSATSASTSTGSPPTTVPQFPTGPGFLVLLVAALSLILFLKGRSGKVRSSTLKPL